MANNTQDGYDAPDVPFDDWRRKAVENVDKWGVQDTATLLLAATEELGELTQAYLEHRSEGGDRARIVEELSDLGALLIQLQWRMTGHPDEVLNK